MKNVKVKNPMQTRHGRIRYKAYSIKQLMKMWTKTTTPKARDKITNELNRKCRNSGITFQVSNVENG